MPLFLHGGMLCPYEIMWAVYGFLASLPFLRLWFFAKFKSKT